MIPVLPELDRFEQLASSENPTLEGAWIHTMQLVEHIFNLLVARDPINNEVMVELLTTILARNEELELETAERPIPYDALHQLLQYSNRALEKIVENPSKKLVKETTMLSPNRLKTPTVKTMDWIAKQPGRNIREKLAGKNRVLAERNLYSIHTKENEVVMNVLKELKNEITNRMDFGINHERFDIQETDGVRYDELEAFLNFVTKLKYKEFGEVKPNFITQPNNKLISDKNYAVIWRTYQSLITRKSKITESWAHIFERYVFSTYLQLLARIAGIQGIQVQGSVGKLIDVDGKISIESVNRGTTVRFFYEPLVEGKVKFINKDQGFGFIGTTNNSKVHFSPGSFQNKEIFEQTKPHDTIYFQSVETKKGETAKFCSKSNLLYDLEVSLKETSIEIMCTTWETQQHDPHGKKAVQKEIRYDFIVDDRDAEFNRGIPFTVFCYKNQHQEWINKQEGFADMISMNELLDMIKQKLQKDFQLPEVEREKSKPFTKDVLNAGIDFTKDEPTFCYNNKLHSSNAKLYMMEVPYQGQNQTIAPSNQDLYNLSFNAYSLADTLFRNDDRYSRSLQSFVSILGNIQQEVRVPVDVPILYTVPDHIDEFSQNDIKKSISVHYHSSFPIWRSVAGALQIEKKMDIKAMRSFLVIDTHGVEASAVQLRRITKDKKSYFQHYPPFEMPEEATLVTLEHYLLSYLEEFSRKFNLKLTKWEKQHLLKRGILERVVLKHEEHLYIDPSTNTPKKIAYHKEIVNIVHEKWLRNWNVYLQALNTILLEENFRQIDCVIILGDHMTENKKIGDIISSRLKMKKFTVVHTDVMLKGIVNQQVKEKLENGEPLWYEYLPNLSLEVVRNGHYSNLNLIKDETIGNTMGMGKVFEVKETMVLPKGQKFYRFPLIRGGASATRKEYNAMIKDVSFPLRNDVEVNLQIEYKYGYENSYKLIVTPANGTVFKQIEAEWLEDELIETQTNSHLQIPNSDFSDEQLIAEINRIERFMTSTEHQIRMKLGRDYADEKLLKRAHRLFHSTVYHVRRISMQHNHLAVAFIERFYDSLLFECCLQIEDYIAPHLYKENKFAVQNFISDVWRYLASFGEYVHEDVWNMIFDDFDEFNSKVIYSLLFQNSENEDLLAYIAKGVRKEPRTVIRTLRDLLWRDTEMLENLYDYDFQIINAIYQEIYSFITLTAKKQRIDNVTVFRDYCEVLLALLALREREDFSLLKIGHSSTKRLARDVRKVDALCSDKEGQPLKSYLQFDLKKIESLSRMSDLAFVVNAYLTGDLMDNLITVRDLASGLDE